MATSKTILQNVAAALGVTVPSSFVGNTAATPRRLLRAYSAAGRYLRNRDWRALTFEHTFATVSGTLSYALPTSPAFHHFAPGTGFDRTNWRKLIGPYNPAAWQADEALLTVSGGITKRFRIKSDTSTPRVNMFYLLDDPGGAYTLAYEYVTHEWLYDGSAAYSDIIAADTDQPVFDDYLMECETLWRALKLLGEAYFDEKDEAMRLADLLFAQEHGEEIALRPRRSIFAESIPEGDWS